MTEQSLPELSRRLRALAEAAQQASRPPVFGNMMTQQERDRAQADADMRRVEAFAKLFAVCDPPIILEIAALLEDAWRLLPSHPHVLHQAADWLDRYERLAAILEEDPAVPVTRSHHRDGGDP